MTLSTTFLMLLAVFVVTSKEAVPSTVVVATDSYVEQAEHFPLSHDVTKASVTQIIFQIADAACRDISCRRPAGI